MDRNLRELQEKREQERKDPEPSLPEQILFETQYQTMLLEIGGM